MKFTIRALIISFLSLLSLNNVKAEGPETTIIPQAKTDFAFKLLKDLNKEKGDQNIFFSPFSISTAFSLAAVGADQETFNQIRDTFGLATSREEIASELSRNLETDTASEKYGLKNASSLWVNSSFKIKNDFLNLTSKILRDKIFIVDFLKQAESSRLKINKWIEGQTADKITNLIPESVDLSPSKAILTNAIYFLGKWQNPFNANSTKEGAFTDINLKQTNTRFMQLTEDFRYSENENASLLEMPYEDQSFAAYMALPKEHSARGLAKILDYKEINSLIENLSSKKVYVKIPKFKIESTLNGLQKTLADLGLKDPFDPNKADFKFLTSDKLFISQVLHKAYVEVDESGTEAAAATALIMRAGSAMPKEKPVSFIADKTFLFIIKDLNKQQILFIGIINSPQS